SWDSFHEKGKDIYRVTKIWRKGEVSHYATTPAALGPALGQEVPGVVNFARFFPAGNISVKAANETFTESGIGFADPTLLDLFTFPAIMGDRDRFLSDPSSALITEETAHRYFGDSDPIGKTIRLNDQFDFWVSGVLADVPSNSHLRFSILLPFESLGEKVISDWHNNSFYTYVLFSPMENPASIPDKMTDCLNRHVPESTSSLFLQPLKDIHLYSSHMRMRLDSSGDIRVLLGVAALAFVILFIAAANFINLGTAQIMGKCKEVWVRKWLGARRWDIFYRYMTESFLIIVCAALMAACIMEIGFDSFSSLIGRDLSRFNPTDQPSLILGIAGLTLFTYALAATYPALVLSGLNPVAIQGIWRPVGKRKHFLRQVLVILQFSLASFSILTATIAINQYRFMDSRNPGYDEKNLVYIQLPGQTRDLYPAFRESLLSDASIQAVAGSANLPSRGMDISTEDITWEGKQEGEELLIRGLGVDYSYIETLRIPVIAGRDFDENMSTDSNNYIINEAAAAAMGMESPIGQSLKLWDKSGTIIGLVADYHYRSLRNPIQPLLLRIYPSQWLRFALVRIGSGDIEGAVQRLKRIWSEIYPDTPIQYGFVDDLLHQMYTPEKKVSLLFSLLALFATIVGCLGIFGLVLFLSEQKTKEIGIRKVLGASTRHVMGILLSETIVCMLFSQILAWPVAYLLTDKLLNNYAYRIQLNFATFFCTTFMIFGAALAIVGFQVIKTVRTNLVESIKYE
ncbi:MAG: ABC transporter permease, partial [candidate division Zixibacteria bacterium]|nr:ABC transporter permease [candidate division Zixibacteria bacterium]